MPSFDIHQIANLVGQLGGDQQQAKQMLSKVGGLIDPTDPQHAKMLQQLGVDPQALQSGAYKQHLESADPTSATIGQGALYGEDDV